MHVTKGIFFSRERKKEYFLQGEEHQRETEEVDTILASTVLTISNKNKQPLPAKGLRGTVPSKNTKSTVNFV